MNEVTINHDLAGIITDYAPWRDDKVSKAIKEKQQVRDTLDINFSYTDWAGLDWLSQKVKFEGFMQAPVGVFFGLPVAARTRVIDNPKDFAEYCNSTPNQIFLYDLIFTPNMPQYGVMDPESYEITSHDVPKVSTEFGKWKVRYGELEVSKEEK
jgi:hypothetical protein